MSIASPDAHRPTDGAAAENWRQRSAWLKYQAIPSWMISVAIHVVVLLFYAWWLSRWDLGPVGFQTNDSREVGIVVKQLGDDPDFTDPNEQPAVADAAAQTDAVDSVDPAAAVPSLAELAPQLPTASPDPLVEASPIGVGRSVPLAQPGDARDLIQQGAGVRPPPRNPGGLPGTAFMGIEDQGTTVVFVIDCSASMDNSNNNAMRTAKAALQSSLEALDAAQRFQIIFYNDEATALRLSDRPRPELYFASELNKQRARNEIGRVTPSGGTEHLLAINLALSFSPEVIYFLTDAAEPALQASQLRAIERKNAGKTRIHTIEFGKQNKLGPENFLQVLARKNGGTYRYVDILTYGRGAKRQ